MARPGCILALCTLIVSVSLTLGYDSGAGSCVGPNKAAHGSARSGNGGFRLELLDGSTQVTKYELGKTYTLRLSRPSSYKGFLVGVVRTDSISARNLDVFAPGTWEVDNTLYHLTCKDKNNGVTHRLGRVKSPRSSDDFNWTAPNENHGEVTFMAFGVVSKPEWYSDIKLVVAGTGEAVVPAPTPAFAPASAAPSGTRTSVLAVLASIALLILACGIF